MVVVLFLKNLSAHLDVRPSSAERCGLPILAFDPARAASFCVATSCDRLFVSF